MKNHHQLLKEALSALEDRWVRLEYNDADGRITAIFDVTFTLVGRSIIAALALDTACRRLQGTNFVLDPGFLFMLSAEAESELVSRLIALDEPPSKPARTVLENLDG